ncbi:MAG: hypothetical protein GY816_11730 [Cytophagales bacterium]|nr:hypothetical protein [Cytophagales bacterium]
MLNSTEVEGVMKRTTSYLADGDLKLVTRSGEKKSLFAREILCYQANGEKHLSFSGELYKEEIDGKGISLYSQIGTNTYTTGGGPNAPMMTHTSSFTMFFVKKENETNPTLVPSEKRKFKAFASYFSECEQVQKSIASGELKSKEVRSVVLRYNNCILRASSDEE